MAKAARRRSVQATWVGAAALLAGPQAAAAAARTALLYAAPTSRGVVNVYPGGRSKPTQPIYSFHLDPGVANSLVIDRQGNLFLADTYSTWVYEYAPGGTTPVKSFPTTWQPFFIAVQGNTLYAYQSQESGGNASIGIYENGHTTVDRALTDPRIVFPQGIAVDAAGNVFAGYAGAKLNEYGIGEFVGGQMPMRRLPIKGLYPTCLVIDRAGNLLVSALAGKGSAIYVFPPGQTTPSLTIPNLPTLYQFSLTAAGTAFYVGDGTGKSFQMYKFPSGKRIYNFKDPDAFVGFAGIAASPSQQSGIW